MDAPPTEPKRRIGRRLKWLLALGLLLIGAAGFYVYFYLHHPIGSGPAGPAVADEAFQDVWTDRPVVLLGFGDSIVAGYGASPGMGVFDRIAASPAADFQDMQGKCLGTVCPDLTLSNIALSGSTSLEQFDVLIPRIPQHPPETFGIVVATIGGNDVIHMYGRTPPREGAMYGATLEQARPWIENFERRLETILDEIAARFPGGHHVFLANIYDPTDGLGDAQNAGLPAWPEGLQVLGAYNDVIDRVTRRRSDTTLVDIRSEFLGHGIHALQFWRDFYDADDPGYWYYDNLEDPNDRGYDALRRLFLNEMARVLPGILRAGGP